MTKADSCDELINGIKVDTIYYLRLVVDEEGNEYGERCHDCGILMIDGNQHHPGCDDEHCPNCGGQLWMGCECKNIDFVSILPKYAKKMLRGVKCGYTESKIGKLK